MAHPLTSNKKASSLSLAIFLVGIGILAITQQWWPGIMLAFGLATAVKHFLLSKYYDMTLSLVVFVGIFIVVQYNISWEIILPVLLILGGIAIFFKEIFGPNQMTEAEKEEDLNLEISEEKKPKK